MQVTETSAAGLKREYRVVVPATDLEARVNERLDDLKGRVQLRGFRPGKVPVAHLKRLYGKAAMAEVIEAAVREANSKIVTDHGFKLATEPKVVLPSEEGAVEGVIAGKSDLAYTVEIEIVPPITLADFKTLKLTRLTAEVTDAEIDETLQRIAEQNRPFIAKSEGAEKGDRVILSFQGTIEGKPFEGGAGEDVPLVLGTGQFIPGFEDHLTGLKAGESRTFDVKFPDDYRATAVAGKDATFAATSPRSLDWSHWLSFGTRSRTGPSASMPRHRARSSSARCSINSMSSTNSSRRQAWSSRNSTPSGPRSRRT
jgi:trigger factor